MIRHYAYDTLGQADFGWLKARYHFSFSRYQNPDRTGFGKLLVINDDRVEGGKGFAPHGHDNMEIITYVRSGAITHEDSTGNKGRTDAGDVQVMSAGSGIQHSEFNLEDEDTTLYQIWIVPNKQNVSPRWEAQAFPKEFRDQLSLLVSGRDEDKNTGALFIYQDAAIYGGRVKAGTTVTQPIKHQAYILASDGSFTVNGQALSKGDGAEVVDEKTLTITAQTDAEIVVIDVPA